jgi:hypothetical protein
LKIKKSMTNLEKTGKLRDHFKAIQDEIKKIYWEKGWKWLNSWKLKSQEPNQKVKKMWSFFLMQLEIKLKEIKRNVEIG